MKLVNKFYRKSKNIFEFFYYYFKNFNFKKYKWKSLTIEKPNLELDLLLDKNGLIQICHSYFDTFYIDKDFIEDANLRNLDPKFLSTQAINY